MEKSTNPETTINTETTKKLIFSFDGTGNSPDANLSKSGDCITNILKLHILWGGSLGSPSVNHPKRPNQRSFYYKGPGTRGGKFTRAVNGILAPWELGMKTILDSALSDLRSTYGDGDEVYVVGLSRGAVLARQFAARCGVPVKKLGVFDTVCSVFGTGDLAVGTKPDMVIPSATARIGANIESALHILALDEDRLYWQPTHMVEDPRVSEVYFPGGHADIGGGLADDTRLAGLALDRMKEYFEPNLITLDNSDILFDWFKDYDIKGENLRSLGDVMGKVHNRKTYKHALLIRLLKMVGIDMDKLLYASREVYVRGLNGKSDSVADVSEHVYKKIKLDPSYDPLNLKI